MKIKITLIIIILFTVVSGYCLANSKFDIAHQLYMKNNYVMAIIHFDDFLVTSQNGAFSTQAELERSDCYHQLGLKAYEKESWLLASRLFFLSNSGIADSKLDDCYFYLAQQQLEQNSYTSTLEYYQQVTSFLQDSQYIPEILFNRIQIYIEMGNKLSAFNDYHSLWKNHPDNSYTKEIQPFIDNLLPVFINEALTFRDSMNYNISIDLLSKLSQYPSKFQDDIFVHISDIYLLKAEKTLLIKGYELVKEYLDIALENDGTKKDIINEKAEDICSQIIQDGNKLVSTFQFDEAIEIYDNCFLLIPDYSTCSNLIIKTKSDKQKYNSALEHENIALQYEKNKEFVSAHTHFNKSYKLFKTERVRKKLYLMSNIIKAEKNPKAFAEKIIKEYENGIIPAGVRAIESSLIAQYDDRVNSSSWKVYYSIGEHKYEVRFDLLSPEDNYYYAWRVNLKTREITPLNKISEDMMKR
jgi:tetratricopeptide (TPR) repeat protein